MKRPAPADFGAASEVRLLLRQLGQTEPPEERGGAAEAERELRMATRIDAELAALVQARRTSRHRIAFALAAAALVLVAFGLRQPRPTAKSLAIGEEPLAPSAAQVSPKVESPPAQPAALPTPRAPAQPENNGPNLPEPSAARSAEAASTLAEENRLFKTAAEADRGGDVDGALTHLDKLLIEHPRSPLAQTALVRKFRLLAKAGRSDAARKEAARYLASYPTGFAVNEARAFEEGVATPSPSGAAEPPGAP